MALLRPDLNPKRLFLPDRQTHEAPAATKGKGFRDNGSRHGTRVGVMIKCISTIVAALIAAGVLWLPSLSPQVQAKAPVFGVKSDRLDARTIGTACSQHEWPYYEASCLRDARNPFGVAREVRIVSADRLPQ
jgi:hypothetical protein